MKTKAIRQKLEKLGYKVIHTFEGNSIAIKGQQTYKAETLNGLHKLMFN